MNEQKTFTIDIRNPGMPVENMLNLIGMVLTTRKIKHKLPVSLDIDIDAYVKAAGNQSQFVVHEITGLYDFLDKLGLETNLEARVDVHTRFVRISVSCI